ncbi:unnamed protein product [Prunus armeniaca]|uniref:Uncharacterized protein n=1 Tax=Prunus armeniaca TaxID=36596 RepID=A0A6J5X2H1_PRUAR|nr:unnamed protein product [Prunus armeniaca]
MMMTVMAITVTMRRTRMMCKRYKEECDNDYNDDNDGGNNDDEDDENEEEIEDDDEDNDNGDENDDDEETYTSCEIDVFYQDFKKIETLSKC